MRRISSLRGFYHAVAGAFWVALIGLLSKAESLSILNNGSNEENPTDDV